MQACQKCCQNWKNHFVKVCLPNLPSFDVYVNRTFNCLLNLQSYIFSRALGLSSGEEMTRNAGRFRLPLAMHFQLPLVPCPLRWGRCGGIGALYSIWWMCAAVFSKTLHCSWPAFGGILIPYPRPTIKNLYLPQNKHAKSISCSRLNSAIFILCSWPKGWKTESCMNSGT